MKQRTRLSHSGDDLISQAMHKRTDGDTNSEIPLHKMKQQEHFIEAQIQEGDTLQALALRFYCSVSELKRINHIHKDNEIYARRTLKVPVTPYSVLTELMPTPQPEQVPSTSNHKPSSIELLLNNTHSVQDAQEPQQSSNKTSNDYSIDCNAVVMNSSMAPAVNPYTDADPCEPISEDTQLLPSKPKEPVESVVIKQLTSQGADFGIKWFHLVCFMLILGVVIPLYYVLFFLDDKSHVIEHPSVVHNDTSLHKETILQLP
ncbi:hypothetical protein O0L34_g7903 [Tuta absoluta]|nr:hypothetical protein O0L34_g7903 [Tuta absoluta]